MAKEKSWVGKKIDQVKQWWRDFKIGEGHAAGMWRMGLKELGQALQPLPTSNIGRIEEPGVFGSSTPALVTEQMGGLKDYNQTVDAGIHGPKDTGKRPVQEKTGEPSEKGWDAMTKQAASRPAPDTSRGMER